MKKEQQIERLLNLDWQPIPSCNYDEEEFRLRRVFDITHQKELHDYIDYVPLPDERVFVTYELYPNLEVCRYCIWSEYDDWNSRKWDTTNYKRALKLALKDKLIVYLHWLQAIAQEHGLTLHQLAKKSNLHHSTLYSIVKNKTKLEKIQLSTLKAIARGLEMPLDDFMYYVIMSYEDDIIWIGGSKMTMTNDIKQQVQLFIDWCKENNRNVKDEKALQDYVAFLVKLRDSTKKEDKKWTSLC